MECQASTVSLQGRRSWGLQSATSTLHRGRRRSSWVPATSVKGSGSPIGYLDPESTGDLRLRIPGRFGVEIADWRPRPRIDRGPPTQNLWLIRGQGLQWATPTPPSRSSVSTEDASDLGGGFGVADWQPSPQIDQGHRIGGPLSIRDRGCQLATPNPPPR
ncbi:hypothetical protein CRG98_044462 [Punica granatum]|uniref:Uncharacterized protein n=1 Tax=Punica granatum TaxID=22663 RepID=A0A2I0HTZ8_PUNGR|nr:hypothetical protein CRG98_044462 [Punica granatum]